MKQEKIIGILLLFYFLLKVVEKFMYEAHHYLRYVVIDLSYGVLTYLTIPMIAFWFFRNSQIKKGTE